MQLDEAHAKLNLVQDFVPLGSSNRPGTRINPTFLTIHNTDNSGPGANAAAHAKYQKNADARLRKVSWHFTVDDKSVFQSIPTNEIAWHAGTSAGNASSVGIEICMHAGIVQSDADERAALLAAVLAKRLGLTVPDCIVQHNHWSGKDCPRVLRHSNGWKSFLDRVVNFSAQLTDVVADDIAEGDHGDHGHGPGEPSIFGDHFVIARDGLWLRAGPGTEFAKLSLLPFGTSLKTGARKGDWVIVKTKPGDGFDGFVYSAFLDS